MAATLSQPHCDNGTWLYVLVNCVIKSPRYTGGDFMFLYRFVCQRRCRPHTFVHGITFEQLFGFLSFLAQILALTYRLPDKILVDCCDLDLEFSRSNMEFAISQPKMVRLPRNEKQTYWLNSRPQMWPSGLTLAMTLTLIFQGQIWNLLYLSPKWLDCHKMKSKHIDWTQGIKCDHQVWPWPWPWPWFFKVKFGIWPYAWCWPRIFMVKFWNSCISGWEGRLTLNKGMGVKVIHMTMTVTIWWPRSGVRIYHIVTGVTSDVVDSASWFRIWIDIRQMSSLLII